MANYWDKGRQKSGNWYLAWLGEKEKKQDMFGTFEVNKTKLEWNRLSEKRHGKVKNVLFYFTKSPDNNMHDSSKILRYLNNFSIRLPLRIQVIWIISFMIDQVLEIEWIFKKRFNFAVTNKITNSTWTVLFWRSFVSCRGASFRREFPGDARASRWPSRNKQLVWIDYIDAMVICAHRIKLQNCIHLFDNPQTLSSSLSSPFILKMFISFTLC